MKNKVELRPAWAWYCDQCDTENYSPAISIELSEEEMKELQDEHGVQPWEHGDWSTIPRKVTCETCGYTFETQAFNTDIDDES